jgi:hypothetical protein
MTETVREVSDLMVNIHQEIEINAPIETVFKSVLDQMGPKCEHPDGTPMAMVLEAWPGGRLYRDLGNKTGHLWGHVQVIKPPTLLEICGPLFMSFPAINHVQYRLKEQPGSTLLIFTHRGMGDIPPQVREGMNKGWTHFLEMIKKHSQK